MEIMSNIASNHDMLKEMMEGSMKGDHCKMLMHERMKTMKENKTMMTNMMKDDPKMANRMM